MNPVVVGLVLAELLMVVVSLEMVMILFRLTFDIDPGYTPGMTFPLKVGHTYRRADGSQETVGGVVLSRNQLDPSWKLAPPEINPSPRWKYIVPDRVWTIGGNHYRASDGRYIFVDAPMIEPTWRDLVAEVEPEEPAPSFDDLV
jgi:hypothetical protein